MPEHSFKVDLRLPMRDAPTRNDHTTRDYHPALPVNADGTANALPDQQWAYEKPTPIDFDKGVIKRKSFVTGAEAFMYKRQPGVFLDRNGRPVSDDVARASGFPVAQLRADREKDHLRELVAIATEKQLRKAKMI
jgi:hypothetical protein